MNIKLVLVVSAIVFTGSSICLGGDSEIRIEQGQRITTSSRVAKADYSIGGVDGKEAVLIEGDNITVDFQKAILVGSPSANADEYVGRGIVIRGKNVTVRNAIVRGYKVGIYAENSENIRLEDCDVSRNYRQHLKSTLEREDLSDWLYGHENDNNEWLRYGSGIYLHKCRNARVERCRARNGQNGLCLVQCDEARVADCDMSFMSGWGLAMWRSSQCEIFNNKFDWCIRGYSHGVYSRGQDSAGILVYEQCHKNVFAFNSATHSGDGLFLYAGNETLKKTGQGGCNGNVFYQNDFSHAAANGIEATFSEGNYFVENTLNECEHGIWAGYSYNSIFEKNTIRQSKNGISIEHGHKNRLTGNALFGGKLGIHLWNDDDKELLDSAFCKSHKGCPSSENIIFGNQLVEFETGIRLVDDTRSAVFDNLTHDCKSPIEFLGKHEGTKLRLTLKQKFNVDKDEKADVTFMEPDDPLGSIMPLDMASLEPRIEAFKGVQNAYLPEGAKRGREFIFVDEWGPYDFKDVRVFPKEISGGDKAVVQLAGIGQPFEVTKTEGGVKAFPMNGQLPARLTIEANDEGLHRFNVEIRLGNATQRVTGTLTKADWKTTFYYWSPDMDPRNGDDAWNRVIEGKPIAERTVPSIDFIWGGKGPVEGKFPDHFATVATASMKLSAGEYRVRTISDDGVRVYVDGKEVLKNWTYHGPTEDGATISLTEGNHDFKVEHFEIDGHAQLQLRVEPVARSGG